MQICVSWSRLSTAVYAHWQFLDRYDKHLHNAKQKKKAKDVVSDWLVSLLNGYCIVSFFRSRYVEVILLALS